jgi:hypothetical protein
MEPRIIEVKRDARVIQRCIASGNAVSVIDDRLPDAPEASS